MRNGTGKRVLIIQGQMKQYRLPFFEKLRAALEKDGVALRVGYSDPPPSEIGKRDNCDLPPEYGVKVAGHWVLGHRIIWQPLLGEVAAADLVIVEQANKYVMNHLLLLCSALGVKKVAFWGLGENRQVGQLLISEWYRRKTLNRPDWWFAYTAGTAEYLVQQGVPRERITAVQNSVDTRELREQVAGIPQTKVLEQRRKLGIADGAPVGIFCGMLDQVKAVPFLIESAHLVKKEISEFHLIIAGGGPDFALAAQAASSSGGWIHSVGPKFGAEKALALKLADVLMLPGRVGLAILDAFAAGLPLLTTDIPIHGPESEYLEHGMNGLKVGHEVGVYARAVINVLTSAPDLQALKQGAARSAERYSIEAMVRNFHEGIAQCLGIEARKAA
jgi:glycosyltransferase involved in cell wall biosynthesis